jgi:hypothetical protein
MNPFVQNILSLLKERRGLVASAVAAEGTDRRLYVQIVGIGGFPVFAVKPSGAYELPFEHTYTNSGMIRMGLPILDGRSEGLNAVLFADKLAARRGNRHDLCPGYDARTIERVREMAISAYPLESENIWRESERAMPPPMPAPAVDQPAYPNHLSHPLPHVSSVTCGVPKTVRSIPSPPLGVRSYFENQDAQQRALEACRQFLGGKEWAVGDRLKLYDASRNAFNPVVAPSEGLKWFRYIYDELVRPARAGGWGIARNASGTLWSAERTFLTVRSEFSALRWGGSVTLPNFHDSSAESELLSALEKMRDFKPIAGWPTMAVSKVLHFYNPELFPIYDREVISLKVLRHFKGEFRQFCWTLGARYEGEDTPIFYRNYMRWGGSLLGAAHSRFMEIFSEWLAKQPGAELSNRHLNARQLFSTAYEYTIIGAYADSVE